MELVGPCGVHKGGGVGIGDGYVAIRYRGNPQIRGDNLGERGLGCWREKWAYELCLLCWDVGGLNIPCWILFEIDEELIGGYSGGQGSYGDGRCFTAQDDSSVVCYKVWMALS